MCIIFRFTRHLSSFKQVSGKAESVNQAEKVNPMDRFFEDNNQEESGKTVVRLINQDENLVMIDTFSTIGFRLNTGIQVLGPCALFPKSVLHWNVSIIESLSI